MSVRLRPELIALIHNVELNRAGWLEKAIDQLIIAALSKAATPISLPDLRASLATTYQCGTAPELIASHLERLCISGRVVRFGNNFKLSETERLQADALLAEATHINDEAQQLFTTLASKACTHLPATQLWESFNNDFLIPYIKETGANTYRLFTGEAQTFDGGDFSRFLGRYAPSDGAALRSLAASFVSPTQSAARRYILRMLTSFLFIAASGMSPAQLAAVNDPKAAKPTFRVVLDTNVIFSILGLHENPADDASLALDRLVHDVAGSVDAKFLALPTTLDETHRVLSVVDNQLRGIETSPVVAHAALSSPSSRIVRRYLEQVSTGVTLSTQDYLRPYVDDLKTVLRGKSIEMLNEPVERVRTTEAFRSDLTDQLNAGNDRPLGFKSYEQLDHDLVLWHVVDAKRGKGVAAPAAARYWIVTLDARLRSFDRIKRRNAGERLPLCLHPATMVQLLQFWIPRTPGFEDVLMNTLRTPILTAEFDKETEDLTIRIVRVLGRYELGDLSEGTIRELFFGDALREKLRAGPPGGDRDDEIVREQIALRLEEVEKSLEVSTAENRGTGAALGKLKGELEASAARGASAEDEVQRLKAVLAQRSEEASLVRAREREGFEKGIRSEAEGWGRIARRVVFISLAVLLSAATGLTAVGVTSSNPFVSGVGLLLVLATAFGLLGSVLGISAHSVSTRLGDYIADWRFETLKARLLKADDETVGPSVF